MEISLMIKLLLAVLFILLACFILYRGTKRQNKLGINTSNLICPNCNELAPKIRKPKNLSQLLWGGFTCEKCGSEVDKWGRLR